MTKNTPEAIWNKIQKGVFIVAEAGKNFIQSEERKTVAEYLENAKELVDKAVWAGADAIKWQTHNVEDEQLKVKVVAAHFKGLDRLAWVTMNTEVTPVQEFWKPLREYCDEKGIIFFSTPVGKGAAKRLEAAGVSVWKVAAGDMLDYVLLDYLRHTNLPIIMSTGANTLEEIEQTFNYLQEKNNRVALVHALSKYPGNPEDAHLAIMDLYREKFPGTPIGFSENSVDIISSKIAVALGATIIEKHFSISRDLWGADHKVCSTPEEFKDMVDDIRKMEKNPSEKEKWLKYPQFKAIYGKKEKILREDEKPFRVIFQKSLSAGMDIPAGTTLTPDMLYALRPRSMHPGIPSEKYEEVLGKKTTKALKKYDPITPNVIV